MKYLIYALLGLLIIANAAKADEQESFHRSVKCLISFTRGIREPLKVCTEEVEPITPACSVVIISPSKFTQERGVGIASFYMNGDKMKMKFDVDSMIRSGVVIDSNLLSLGE